MASTLGRRLLAASRLARWEREVERAIGRALARRRQATLANITARALTAALDHHAPITFEPDDPADARLELAVTAAGPFDEDEWDTDVDEEVRAVIEGMLDELSRGVVGAFQLGDNAGLILGRIDVASQVDHFVRLVTGIGPDLARRIHDELAQGVGLGESIPQIAERVDGVFAMAERRATLIARTETNRAANAGLSTAAGEIHRELPLVKTWLATEDERTRDDHADTDGQTVPYDEAFDVGGEAAMFPCDPDLSAEQACNCRCTLTFEAAADVSDGEAEAAIVEAVDAADSEALAAGGQA